MYLLSQNRHLKSSYQNYQVRGTRLNNSRQNFANYTKRKKEDTSQGLDDTSQ